VYPCDEILIVDHGSVDRTVNVAREYGAKILVAESGASAEEYLQRSESGWILCLRPRESLTEGLAASLFEWKFQSAGAAALSVLLREETSKGWIEHPAAQTRLIPFSWNRWHGDLPAHEPGSQALEGELLSFEFP
jgi:glycosyltransferase involved in cell wall biosynthesis